MVKWQAGTGVTLSDGNLTATVTSQLYTAKADTGRSGSGKYYLELKITGGGNVIGAGIVNSAASLTTFDISSNNQRTYYNISGNKYPENTSYGAPYTIGDTIGILLNFDENKLVFYKNGISQGVSHSDLNSLGLVFPSIKSLGTALTVTANANFGGSNFEYIPPDLPQDVVAYDGSRISKRGILLKSKNKIYSFKSEEISHETKMTSNTAPAPFVVSASSVHSSGTFPVWKAFNGTDVGTQDCWISANSALTGWIQINYGKKMKVNRLSLRSPNYANYSASMAKDFDILYSDDGVNFTSALTVKGQSNWGLSETREFNFKEVEARFFRIDISEANNTTYITIGEVLFGYYKDILTQIPKSLQRDFVDYGMSELKVGLPLHSKNYILQDTVSEDTDGLWKQELNRKPLSIKFE